jgi:hypothetical protein
VIDRRSEEDDEEIMGGREEGGKEMIGKEDEGDEEIKEEGKRGMRK